MATSYSRLRQLPLPLEGEVFTILLTRSQETVVDAVDADVAKFRWKAHFDASYAGGGKYVAYRNQRIGGRKRTMIQLHRVIVSRMLNRPLLRTEQVDHIDRDPLNNRRGNLRLATPSQNAMNRGVRVDSASGYKCVTRMGNKWVAYIRCNGKQKHLGTFVTPELAHEAYCAAARALHGAFAWVE